MLYPAIFLAYILLSVVSTVIFVAFGLETSTALALSFSGCGLGYIFTLGVLARKSENQK